MWLITSTETPKWTRLSSISRVHSFWSSLLKVRDFMIEFVTPIVKKERLGDAPLGWTIKYYKDLGKHGKDFIWVDGDAILLAFEDNVQEVANPKGKAGPKKAPAKKCAEIFSFRH
ncbi:hypothetical protein ACET3Z_030993 [Daucus carota]